MQAADAGAREGRRRLCRPRRQLVKVNVDEEKFIAAQFRIQSIPTVYALFQGQPVADLSSARTEGQLTRTLDQILSQLPIESEAQQREAEVEPLVEMGEQVLAEGDAPRAANIFRQIVEMAPEHAEAVSGLARALIAGGEIEEARATLADLPEKIDKDAAIARARSALALAEIAPAGESSELEQGVAANPDDLEARYELAGALMGRGERDAAADQLLDIVRTTASGTRAPRTLAAAAARGDRARGSLGGRPAAPAVRHIVRLAAADGNRAPQGPHFPARRSAPLPPQPVAAASSSPATGRWCATPSPATG